MTESARHAWRFVRVGGFDQVRIDRGADLARLGELDPKLWVALACPVKGMEFDAATLALIDTDHDGYIRVPELVAAGAWATRMLRDHGPLERGEGTLALAAIDDSHEEGRLLRESAHGILAGLGKAGTGSISCADTADIAALYARLRFNGDGIVTPALAAGEDADALAAIIATLGGEKDRSGEAGADEARINRFFDEAAALLAWHDKGSSDDAVRALGDATAAAAASFRAVRAKVDDFFTRTRLAAFDGTAVAALNPPEAAYAAISASTLAAGRDEIAALPLARVAPGAALPLAAGVNPAWQARLAAFAADVVAPVLGGAREELTAADWARICALFDAHEAWLATRPATPVEQAGLDALRRLAVPERRAALLALVAQDKAAAPQADAMGNVDRLLRYCRDLMLLANNFVSFREFYAGRKSVFQAGTLYLDGRSCDLVLKVLDAGRHATLATLGGVYLVYCDCVRGSEKMQVAAAFTDGDADQLMVGRNGVFWDRRGNDWNATITKIVDHPISVRQAFWTPYKKVARFIGEQANKFAASKSEVMDKQLAAGVEAKAATVATPPPAAPAAPPAPFDIAKFAGIFAAIGLALGALGTALAAVVSGFLSLPAWQMPLVAAGVMLLVSGPSMLLAFFKLRRRNLGPLLDANGWAVNARARINIPFGTSLTRLAELPEGAERSLVDPYAEKKPVWPWLLLAALLAGAGWYGWQQWQQAQAAAAPAAEAAAPPAPPAAPG